MRAYLTPRMLGAHLLALVCVAAATGLGVWQFQAWQARRVAEATDLTRDEPVPLAEVMGPDDRFPGDRLGQPVTVTGTWLDGSTTFVSGREDDGTDGYWVVTPVAVDPGTSVLPVVRGWVASPDDAPTAPTGTTDLVGWLQPSEGTGAADDDPTDDVYPQLRLADLAQRVDQDLYEGYVVADAQAPDALNAGTDGLVQADLEELPEASRFTALRNFLYALEWWVFAGFAAFIWWRFVRESQESEREDDPVASGV